MSDWQDHFVGHVRFKLKDNYEKVLAINMFHPLNDEPSKLRNIKGIGEQQLFNANIFKSARAHHHICI